jgi:hypothetical protein
LTDHNPPVADTEAKDMYGSKLKQLEEVKSKYDPNNLFSYGLRLAPRPLNLVN